MNMKDFITLLKSYHIEDDFSLIDYADYFDQTATEDVKRLNKIIVKVATCGIGYIDDATNTKDEKVDVYNNSGRFVWNVVKHACACRLVDVPEAVKIFCYGWHTINGFGDTIDDDTLIVEGTDMDGQQLRKSLGLIASHWVKSEQDYLIPYLDAINSEKNAEYWYSQKTPLEQLSIRMPVADDSWDYLWNP